MKPSAPLLAASRAAAGGIRTRPNQGGDSERAVRTFERSVREGRRAGRLAAAERGSWQKGCTFSIRDGDETKVQLAVGGRGELCLCANLSAWTLHRARGARGAWWIRQLVVGRATGKPLDSFSFVSSVRFRSGWLKRPFYFLSFIVALWYGFRVAWRLREGPFRVGTLGGNGGFSDGVR